MMHNKPTIVLLRNELRLSDNPALLNAAKLAPIIPIFIYDTEAMGEFSYGSASKYWLHHSLISLTKDFAAFGVNFILRKGNTVAILNELVSDYGACAIYMTRNYEPFALYLENEIHAYFCKYGIDVKRFGGNLLTEPENITTAQGTNFQVFTPFFKALLQSNKIRQPLPPPKSMTGIKAIKSDNINDWKLLPDTTNWSQSFDDRWQIGEEAAKQKLEIFLNEKISYYEQKRDFPVDNASSLLSPHLRFGEITPSQIYSSIMFKTNGTVSGGYYKFVSELAWREFSYSILLNNPTIKQNEIKKQYSAINWRNSRKDIKSWQKGMTGFPIIDAGMRELWQSGYMHNRVRMLVASFLIKDLLVDWRIGEKWFWDCLLDADPANNPASWQWVAGCGMDAAPYFRIFNPSTQSQKFDPDGQYIKQWVPELRNLAPKYIHAPETAPKEVLENCGIILGKTYPYPIINHGLARQMTLEAYSKSKQANKDL